MTKAIFTILTLAGFAYGAEMEVTDRLSVDGSSIFRSTAVFSGSVGIGTTNPTSKLQIQSPTTSGLINELSFNNYLGGERVRFSYDVDNMKLGIAVGSTLTTPQITFDSSGNVGIGTTVPGVPLHVYQNATIATPILKVQNAGSGGYSILNIDRASSARVIATSYSLGGTDEWYTGELYNGGSANTKFSIAAGNALSDSKVVIQSDGNVGIGTTNPLTAVDIYHSSIGPALRIGSAGTGTSNDVSLDFYVSNAGIVPAYARIGLGVDNGSFGNEQGYLTFSTINGGSLSEKLRITKEGNVGIGMTNPTSKLDVKGTRGIYDSNGTTTAQPLYQEIAFSKDITGTSAVDVARVTLPDNYSQGYVEFIMSGLSGGGYPGRIFAKRFYASVDGAVSFTLIGADDTNEQTVTFVNEGNAFKIQTTNPNNVTKHMSVYIRVYGGGSDNPLTSNGVISIAAL